MSNDGTKMAIGTLQLDTSSNSSVMVFEYRANTDTWNQLGPTINGDQNFDGFGSSVSLNADGSRLAIGAPLHNTNAAGQVQNDAGQVRVFEYTANTNRWIQLGNNINGQETGSTFGRSVSLSADGSRLAVGEDGAGSQGDLTTKHVGQVRVFEFNNNNNNDWRLLGNTITDDSNRPGISYGRSVSLSANGSRVAVGSRFHDTTAGGNAGQVRIFELDDDDDNNITWTAFGDPIDGEQAGANFGISVSLSANGTRVAVGAQAHDTAAGGNAGQVQIFELDDDDNNNITWTALGDPIDGGQAGANFGNSVSLSANGTRVAVGALAHDTAAGGNAGQVRIFELDDDDNNNITWTALGDPIDGGQAGAMFGDSVSLSANGSRLAVGENLYDTESNTNAGRVRVFESNRESYMRIKSNGNVGIGTNEPGTVLQIDSTAPYLTLKNTTAENGEGGCESRIIFEDHADASLAVIEASHDGTANDTRGQLTFSTHNGSDLVENVIIDGNGDIVMSTGIKITTNSINIPDEPLEIISRADSNDLLKLTNTASTGRSTLLYDTILYKWEIGARGNNLSPINSFYIHRRHKVNNATAYSMIITENNKIGFNTHEYNTIDDNMVTMCTTSSATSSGVNFLACYNDITPSASDGRWILRWAGASGNYNVEVIMFKGTNEVRAGWFENDSDTGSFDFTGQHRSLMNKNYTSESVGLIVSSNGKYVNMDNSLNPTINESLPYCLLSIVDNDKKVFGVISEKETEDYTRGYGVGYIAVIDRANTNEQRMIVNSLGEGAIWVCNKNGTFENGDYITTTSVPGYGGKQADDILHSYTVAKITCDCDFSLTKIAKQIVKVFKTTDETGNTTTSIEYDANGDVQYEDDLDENGNQQMEYPFETRFLASDGTRLADEAEYTTRLGNGEAVYIACFVGCTYHCG
jgi:hypothetical protein